MELARYFRRHHRFLAVFAFQAVLGLGMLDVYRVAHEYLEPDCPARTTGNPNTCFICSHLSYISADTPETVPLSVHTQGQVREIVLVVDRVCSAEIHESPARSPPASA